MGNELKNIDKLIFHKLNGNTIDPSDNTWSAIETSLDKNGVNNPFLKRTWPLFLILGSAIIAISVVLIFSNPNDDPMDPQSLHSSHSSPGMSNQESNKQPTTIESKNKIEERENTVSAEKTIKEIIETDVKSNKTTPSKTVSEEAILSNNQLFERVSPLYLNSIEAGLIPWNFNIPTTDILPIYDKDLSPFLPELNKEYYKRHEILFGAHFTPGIIYYDKSDNRNNYSFELTFDYKPSRFFIQSGIGVGYFTEHGNTSVSYRSYDSVGFYYDVQSFTMHPEYPDSIIFNLKVAGIYDSVDHIDIKQVTNKYLYLQVPLNFGFILWEKNRLSLSMRTGVIFSLMLYKDEPNPDINLNDVTITGTEKQYPGRLKTNIRWMFGLGMNYTLSKKLKFSIEPVFTQYFHPVYKNGSGYNSRMPYSIGLRTGFYLNY